MGAYTVLLVIAALGIALGWRLTPRSETSVSTEGLARLLQISVTMVGLLALTLLAVPWFVSLSEIACDEATIKASECVVGVKDRGLFGASAYMCAIGAAFAFVLRKGVFDSAEPQLRAPRPLLPPTDDEPKATTDGQAKPDSEPESPKSETPESETPESETPESETPESKPGEAGHPAHRKLEGPVFQAFVDDATVPLDEAIETAVRRLTEGGKRIAVVFSRGASSDANLALHKLAEALGALRYVLEGTTDVTEGLPSGEAPDPTEADELAGSEARHAGQLALDLAGTLIETVMLLDTRVAFPQFVLGRLTEVQSVCIAHSHDDVSAACQVLLPGTNPGEKQGELIDDEGATNLRQPRAWLVNRMLETLAARTKSKSEAEPDSQPTASSDSESNSKPEPESNSSSDSESNSKPEPETPES